MPSCKTYCIARCANSDCEVHRVNHPVGYRKGYGFSQADFSDRCSDFQIERDDR